ncbi:2-amino-4-hydroxy-6-hydroxymethyldihydropteridine diphosphokinase [Wohlfahrtiimonas chitiniclastica]|uniref:2-amino-4-hydroxy-6- hydroxymethyldihydropteridine diphosphokinase n=1 Tax=Wohlfahrtiimonas chitiniclastica TaxID=400946 RepID=UPI001BCB6477|nr:2-amino-4-hydroxy-6-hydroxymethyldihydropteridine diphosphokinase [Wohlfahrtiimonas chitiniclastica]MBS7821491.1 2-amino-4-hydroxy-6-hydroxymethyldihydropteridine diphosphokinase [Wohlfahrtiimonas chitiniclastica]
MHSLSTTYIALGANLENPVAQLTTALEEIAQLPNTSIIQCSKFYRTKPIGPAQPDIINAVIALQTALSPYELLHALQAIELKHGRTRTVRFGARTLDLDVLLYEDWVNDDSALIVPHPRMHERNFVLIPLYEIAPDLILPQGAIADLIARNDPEAYVIPLDL